MSFDIDTAILLAKASYTAYSDSASHWAGSVGLGKSENFSVGDTQGFYAWSGDSALLAFRGTSQLAHWLRDASIFLTPHQWGQCHSGFLDGLHRVHQHMKDFAALARPKKRVLVTGHSLGGAYAILAAALFKSMELDCLCYTFGQPRVGNNRFADNFDHFLPENVFRVINQDDIVPRLPPPLFYRHCGKPKRITADGRLEKRSVTGIGALSIEETELPAPSEAMMEAFLHELEKAPEEILVGSAVHKEGLFGISISDHGILEYISMLNRIKLSQKS